MLYTDVQTLTTGDTLVATKLDRLGRSVIDVSQIINDLLQRRIIAWTLDIVGPMDDSPTGRVMRTVMLAFAELERDLIVQRTQVGKAIARQRPDYREGRKPKYSRAQYDHAMELLTENSYTQVSSANLPWLRNTESVLRSFAAEKTE